MIIVKLMGGLGNQMFQYALGRSLSMRHGTNLKLDLSFLEGEQQGNTPRKFELDRFCIAAEKATRWEIISMKESCISRLEAAVVRLILNKTICLKYKEKFFCFDPLVLTLPDNTYLDGFWQSERYFYDISNIIRNDFTVRNPLNADALCLSEEIRTVNSVSLHIRRGDYVTDTRTRNVHGVCNLEYYSNAEKLVSQTIRNPHFFVFSDDPDWAARNLKLNFPVTIVNRHINSAHEDLNLMSLCRHHVIANSSFSWWGAWLSNSPEKIVVAPKSWFTDSSINTSDLIPSGWHRL
jgi:hypothetical protein